MDLEMLNRLRVNAGKPELAAWKASKVKLVEAIKTLQAAGFTDALPGADLTAKPVTDDPVVAKVLPEANEPEPEIRKNPEDRKEPKVTNGKAKLGRGLETEPMARQSRIAVQMERDREKREASAAKKEEKAAKKTAKVEEKPKKKKPEPKKAEKKSAPVKIPKNDNEITVADICRELDIDPKIGRAKLRRHKDKLAKLYAKGVTEGWTFPKAAKSELVNILK